MHLLYFAIEGLSDDLASIADTQYPLLRVFVSNFFNNIYDSRSPFSFFVGTMSTSGNYKYVSALNVLLGRGFSTWKVEELPNFSASLKK